jgi:TRAP transporter TAXI family solute receptor
VRILKPLRRVISRVRKFTQFSVRDLIAAAGPTVLAIVAVCALAYALVDPQPPRRARLATGQVNSAYEEFGKQYAASLAKQGIEVTLVRSLGSAENLQLLREGKVDIAFVQSGSTDPLSAERTGLVSIGSLFTEPVWLFVREQVELKQISELKGKNINVGPEGTGVPRLFRQVLAANGVDAEEVRMGTLENTPGTMALIEGSIDGLVFSSAPEEPLIQMLLRTPGIRLVDFSQAEAYTRQLPFLSHVVLPRGIVDLASDNPSHLIAPTATMVARADLHPALLDLLVQAASQIHGGTGWFQQQGQFPSSRYTEVPVAREAAKFYKDGAPLLQQYMSFWLANFFDRMWVIVVALGALLIPLSRVVPPLYVWRIRSRLYRWYGQLRVVEQELADAPDEERAKTCAALMQRLDEIEAAVNQISIPLPFTDALYSLRSHIQFVRQRVRTASAPAQG